MRYAQLVMGPAGCGKSTYCSHLVRHAQDLHRVISVVNLDPAAEYFDYEVIADIRDLIHLSDVMEDEDLRFGPNGGLIFCLEYLLQNIDWLEDQLGDDDDDYILFDCPGQIELYTHLNLMKQLVSSLQNRNFHLCGIFLLDSQFMVEPSKFFAGSLTALSAMVNLEIPHINILSKLDLLNKSARKKLDRYLEPDIHLLFEEEVGFGSWSAKYQRLSEALGKIIDDYSLVRFLPLNLKEPESITDLLLTIDNAIQFGEDADVKTKMLDNEIDPTELDQKDENNEEYVFPHINV